MVKALFDTNILIDFLNAAPQARQEIDLYREKAISIVTWMEVMVGAPPSVEAATRTF
jgi:predicted nucleic acid-binding protein